MLLSQVFNTSAVQKGPGRVASVFLGKEEKFGDLKSKIGRLSYLYQNDIGAGARVAFLSNNSPMMFPTFVALSNNRCITIPLDPRADTETLGAWIKESGATHLAAGSDLISAARKLLSDLHLNLPIIDFEKKQGGEYDPVFTPPSENTPKEGDIILLLRTQGVQAPARLAAFDHTRLHHATGALRTAYQLKATDRLMSALGPAHPFSFLHGILFPGFCGFTSALDPGVERKDYFKLLTDCKVTHLLTTPDFAQQLLASVKQEGVKLAHLRTIVVSVGPVLPALRSLAQSTGTNLISCYGQTEAGWTIAMDQKGVPGLKYKVLDPNGDMIEGKGLRVGRLAVSGPSIMKAYFGSHAEDTDQATKQAVRGTWLYTEDVARLEGDGDLLTIEIVGRKDEVLPIGKDYFSPLAIDLALEGLPGVVDGAAFVVKGKGRERHIVCAVVRAEKSLIKGADVLEYLRQRLPENQWPSSIVFAESIPRGLGGVARRTRLSRQFEGVGPGVIAGGSQPSQPGGVAPQPVAPPDESPAMPEPAMPEPEVPAPTRAPSPPPGLAPLEADESHTFITLNLDQILAEEPLPATLYFHAEMRFVPFRRIGMIIDRETYDRLELKRIHQLFILERDLPIFQDWARRAGATLSDAAAPVVEPPPRDPAFAAAQKDLRALTLKVFRSPTPQAEVARIKNTSAHLVDTLIASPHGTRMVAEMQKLPKGTVDHSVNVSVLSVYLALQMGYGSRPLLQHVAMGGLMHDIGKTKVHIFEDDSIEEAEAKNRQHPAFGLAVVEADRSVPREVKMIIEQHHECHDGSGYPNQLRGSGIFELARIVAIANRFDNLVAIGRGPLKERQINAIHTLAGPLARQFDPLKLKKALNVLSLGI